MPTITIRRTSVFGYPIDVDTHALKSLAYDAYHMGHFDDAFELAMRLGRRNGGVKHAYEMLLVASAARGDHHFASLSELSWDISAESAAEIRLKNPVECLWFDFQHEELSVFKRAQLITSFVSTLRSRLWIAPTAQPVIFLRFAKWLLGNGFKSEAIDLVNCCLGWRYVYRRIDDLILLSELLNDLRAPKVFWSHLANIYFDFSTLDSVRQCMLKNCVPRLLDGTRLCVHWSEVDRREGVFHRFCVDRGLPERDAILTLLFEMFELSGYAKGKSFEGKPSYVPVNEKLWLAAASLEKRHPWYQLLTQTEQDFIRNGDTFFVSTVTTDFSGACSQWWRCIESMLRRKLIDPLAALLERNPLWLECDHGLSQTKLTYPDELFIRHLPYAERRKKLTLYPMLVLLNSCLSDIRKKQSSPSVVRNSLVAFMATRLPEFRWVNSEMDEHADMRSLFSPNVFTEKAIQRFRNAAAHDEPMHYTEAAVGRLLAIRILDFMHYPRYCIEEKLLELVTERSAGDKLFNANG